jgi:hypothetical protein
MRQVVVPLVDLHQGYQIRRNWMKRPSLRASNENDGGEYATYISAEQSIAVTGSKQGM